MQNNSTGFIPTEDQGFIVFSVNLPPGASLDRTQKVMDRIDSLLTQVEAVERRGAVTGIEFRGQCKQFQLCGWVYPDETTRKKRAGK